MTRLITAAALLAAALTAPARADEAKDAAAVLDKAIKALGGEEKIGKAKAVSWKAKGAISVMGMEIEMSLAATVKGLDAARSEFAGNFGGMEITGATVVAGEKGWRAMNGEATELDADALANAKRELYLGVGPMTVLPLKGKGFKAALAGEEKVDGKPAAVVEFTPADGKKFKVYFDKETGLPVRTVGTVVGFMGDEAEQVTTYSDYKDMGGIKKASKSVTTRGGEKFITQEITEFKLLDKADDKLFEKP